MLDDPPSKRKWPRNQRFELSSKGREADQQYKDALAGSRQEGAAAGRGGFDTARTDWAKALAVQPDDALYITELASGPKTLHQLIESMEDVGTGRREAVAALERLLDAGLVESIPGA